jgi:hypothetical protein
MVPSNLQSWLRYSLHSVFCTFTSNFCWWQLQPVITTSTLKVLKTDLHHTPPPPPRRDRFRNVSFLGIIIQMSHDITDRLRDYWTTEQFLTSLYSKTSKRDRFLHILRFLHFIDNNAETDKPTIMADYGKFGLYLSHSIRLRLCVRKISTQSARNMKWDCALSCALRSTIQRLDLVR